ncbi:hypothetical protein [Streptomyces massasporeus]
MKETAAKQSSGGGPSLPPEHRRIAVRLGHVLRLSSGRCGSSAA